LGNMTSPSFMRLFADLRKEQGPDHPIWDTNSKLDGRKFAEDNGVPVPALRGVFHDPRDIPEPEPLPIVLKPNDGCNTVGVFPLVPWDGEWRSHITGAIKPWDGWTALANQVPKRPTPQNTEAVEGPWLLEGMVGDGTCLPDLVKYHVIHGRTAFTSHAQRTPWAPRHDPKKRVAYWTPEGEYIEGGVMSSPYLDPTLPLPAHYHAMREIAERLAGLLPTPYARIDFFDDPTGPIFNEVTPHSGRARHAIRTEWDRTLGELWATG
jgi:hypothetical protein